MSQGLARALVFISSAAVLVLEVAAGRLMAPYVGVSLETFTGIIGTVLAAIALGSWVGGRVADERPPGPLVGPAFLVGGILALLAPTVIVVVGPAFRGGGAVAIIIVTALAFFAPAVVLSAVTPLVVKLRLQSLEQTGEVVGSLSALGTAGALVGTFATGFVALAAWPTRPIVIVVGAILVAIGVALMARDRRRRRAVEGAVFALGAALLVMAAPTNCEWETIYSCANIRFDDENASGRFLELNTLSHSYVDLEDPTNLRFRYIKDFAATIEVMAEPGPLKALALGGGGFTMPRYLHATRPGSEVTVFEIDDALVDLVRSELALSPEVATVVTDDARVALDRVPEGTRYDVIMGDAFASPSVPWHLTTLEFVEQLHSVLADDGVYVMNVIDYNRRELVRAETATLAAVFDHVAVVAPAENTTGTGGGNFVLVAADRPVDAEALNRALVDFGSESVTLTGDEVTAFVDGADILIDDYAPADQLIDYPHWRR